MSFADLHKDGDPRPQRPRGSPRSTGQDRPGEFQALLWQAQGNIDIIADRVKAIGRIVALLASARTNAPQLHSKVGLLQGEVQRYIKETQDVVDTLEALPAPGAMEASQRKQQIGKCRGDLAEYITACRGLEASIAKAQTAALPSQQHLAAHETTLRATDEEGERRPLLADQYRPMQTLLQVAQAVDHSEGIIQEREEAIQRIHSEVIEVNSMFRDMGHMVAQQANPLDQIEANLSSVDNATAKGLQELTQARHHQKKAMGKKCCLLFVGLIVLAVLATVVFMSTQARRK